MTTTNSQKLDRILEWIGGREERKADPEVVRRLGDIEGLLREQNGCLKQFGQVQAAHTQWIETHEEKVHPALDKRVDANASKINLIGSLNATLTAIVGGVSGAIALLRGGK